MFSNPSLVTRIAVGKGIGFAIGLIGFIALPYFAPDTGWMVRWGVLFWYVTVGAFIGFAGVFTWHPVLHLPLPWWVRAPLIGAWMNFVLTLFAYDTLAKLMETVLGAEAWMRSPFWSVGEGALVGLLIGYAATKLGGEGKDTVGH